jgi:hypothetical protein
MIMFADDGADNTKFFSPRRREDGQRRMETGRCIKRERRERGRERGER